MTLLQAWLFVGLPSLVLGLAMFVGRSRWRPLVGYAILLLGFVTMALLDGVSAAIIGVILVLLYASGRGGRGEERVDPLTDTGVDAAERAERQAAEEDPLQPR